MVDVSDKGSTERIAIAEGRVIMRKETLDLVVEGNAMKGDVLGAARLAGIMPAKRTHGLIPLCHPLPLTKVEIDINPEHALPGFLVQATVKVTAKTGVRNGGSDGGLDRVPDDLRHGQGGRARHADRRHSSAAQEWRKIRRVARGGVTLSLMPVAEALQRVLADAKALPAEMAPLSDTLGRVLTEDVSALRTQPPAAVSAMDGYAVRANDIAQSPVKLKLLGEVAAGHPFEGEIGSGEAARIFTGGVMPKGSDTVVIQELATSDGKTVTIQKATATGRNVRAQGIDFTQGQPLLHKGQRLSDRDLMLAAAMNHPRLRACTGSPKWRRSERAMNWCNPAANSIPAKSVIRMALLSRRSRAAKAPRFLISVSRKIVLRPSRPVCAGHANGVPTSWSPQAAPRLVSMIWCSARWRLKVSICRSGGWPFGPAGR